jgi:hypothetical protein
MSSRAEPPCCALHAHTTCRTPGGVWVDVLVCGLDRELDIDPDDDDSYPDLPDAMHFVAEHGGVAYIAHPYWTGVPMDPGGRAAGRRRHRGLQRRLPDRVRPRPVTLCTGPEDGGRAMVGRLAFRHRAKVVDRDPSTGLITAVAL